MKQLKHTLIMTLLCGLSLVSLGFYREGASEIETLLKTARASEVKAQGKTGVTHVIQSYEEVLKKDPTNYVALCKVGNYKSLLGAAYSPKKREKKKLYLEAGASLVKAMRTNPAFEAEIEQGKSVAEAARVLTIREIDAMGYWFTVNFYYYKECLGVIGKVRNVELIEDCNKMIDHVELLDSTWSGGGVYFSKAIYYIAMPEKFGGSKSEAKRLFEKALSIAPDMICNRWGRAKYLYALTGEEDKYRQDLEWVIESTETDNGDNYLPPAWNAHFRAEAKKMLAEID